MTEQQETLQLHDRPKLCHFTENRSPEVRNIQENRQSDISPKSYTVYVLLDLFFGIFGIHNMYAGFVGTGIIQLILSCTLLGPYISLLWCILELFFKTKDASGRKML